MRARSLVALALSLPQLAAGNCVDTFKASFEGGQQAKRSDLVTALLCIEQSRSGPSALPVGTIVASMLSPTEFAQEVGDPAVFDARVSRWTLANGRDVSLSKYKTAALSLTVPDLRGMFLRGMNHGRNDGLQDPESNRLAGSTQRDELKKHSHELAVGWHGLASGKGTGNLESGKPPASTQASGGDETRPRNVAVHYYVKIN